MQSKIIEQAEIAIEEAKTRLSEIEQAEDATLRAKEVAKKQIAALKEQLPGILAARALGSDSQNEINRVKGEICELREVVRDAPGALAGLEILKRPEKARLRDAKRVVDKLDRYLELKERIEQENNISLCSHLRDYARALGLESDCEEFIRSLPNLG